MHFLSRSANRFLTAARLWSDLVYQGQAQRLCLGALLAFLSLAPSVSFAQGGACTAANGACLTGSGFYRVVPVASNEVLMSSLISGCFTTGPQYIIIPQNHTLKVDVDYTFVSGSEVVMEPGSQIVVCGQPTATPATTATLTLDQTTVRSCSGSNDWGGITVNAGCTLKVLHVSTIQNAQTAILAQQNSLVQLNKSKFLDNNVGIDGLVPFTLNMSGTTIAGGANSSAVAGNTGIRLTDPSTGSPVSSMAIGASASVTSWIFDYETGIYAQSVDLTVTNVGISRTDNTYSQFGVKVEGTSLKKGNLELIGLGGLETSTPTIEKVKRGIEFYDGDLTVSSARISNVEYGIVVQSSATSLLDINGNTIDAFGVRGFEHRNTPVADARIIDNRFIDNIPHVFPALNRVGIIVENVAVAADHYLIQLNRVLDEVKPPYGTGTITERHFGIVPWGSPNITIDNNFVETAYSANTPHRFHGIYVLNSGNVHVTNNTVQKRNYTDHPDEVQSLTSYGIAAETSPSLVVSCNLVAGIHTGIDFWGDCGNTVLAANEMRDNYVGLYLWSGAQIGMQFDRHNRWTNTVVLPSYYEALLSNPADAINSQFYVYKPLGSTDQWPSPVAPASNWFFLSNTGMAAAPCPVLENGAGSGEQEGDGLIEERSVLSNALGLSPNPAYDIATLKFDQLVSGRLRVYDSTGRLITEQTLRETASYPIEIAGWPSGIYWVEFKGADGQTLRQKLAVSR
jgi:hypothetical protein